MAEVKQQQLLWEGQYRPQGPQWLVSVVTDLLAHLVDLG